MNWLALLCDPKLNATFSFKWSVAYQDFIKTSILIVAQPRDPILVERFRLQDTIQYILLLRLSYTWLFCRNIQW